MTIVGLLVFLIVFGLLFWATQALCTVFGIPEPVRTVIIVLLVLIAVLYLLQTIGFGVPGIRIQ